jgi:selenide,water dikinase
MGARPLTALAIAGFPKEGLGHDRIGAVFRGGFDKLREAGVALLGGHTVQDPEIKFGYAVTGAVDPARMWSNAGAREGDVILLTKPLGTGVVGTAIKNGRAPAALEREAVANMCTLNKAAAEALAQLPAVHACTDITGFGFIGHASKVANANGVTLAIDAAAVPLLDGVRALVAANRSRGMKANRAHFGSFVQARMGLDDDLLDLLYDPQTSGGLLAFVPAADVARALEMLRARGVDARVIGTAIPATGCTVELR